MIERAVNFKLIIVIERIVMFKINNCDRERERVVMIKINNCDRE